MSGAEPRLTWRPSLSPDDSALVRIWVPGEPRPQGSMKGFSPKGTTFVNMTSDNKHTPLWRAEVKQFVANYMRERDLPMLVDVPVFVHLYFVQRRLSNTPKTRATPPHIRKPDLDKVTRTIYDALSGIVYRDDNQVVEQYDDKRAAELGEQMGCWIVVGERVGSLLYDDNNRTRAVI